MLEFTESPADVLAVAGGYLAADPVVTTVIASVTARLAVRPGAYGDLPYSWWAVVRGEDQQVCGMAMRTAPFEPHPAYVLPMPDDAALALARALHERNEPLTGVNGALPAARIVAEETARLTGGTARVDEHLRLFELGTLVMPPSPPGRLRAAAVDDADLCLRWFREFHRAAAEQVGREGTHGMGELFTLEDMVSRIEEQVIWLWVDEDERPVHLTGASPPAAGVARIGPVYTPREHRGHGYASRAVAEVSRVHVDRGVRCCLFTDQANPTSNGIYQALGYRAVADMVNLLVS
ncbi:MAG: GNAT family N-acetyltransferase [Nocardioides sp.]